MINSLWPNSNLLYLLNIHLFFLFFIYTCMYKYMKVKRVYDLSMHMLSHILLPETPFVFCFFYNTILMSTVILNQTKHFLFKSVKTFKLSTQESLSTVKGHSERKKPLQQKHHKANWWYTWRKKLVSSHRQKQVYELVSGEGIICCRKFTKQLFGIMTEEYYVGIFR